MAITQINDYAIGDSNLTAIMETLDKTYKGKADITISNYDNDSASDVKVGSVFENNGSLFIVDTSDMTPTNYSGISNSTTFYLFYNSTNGTFYYWATPPTWDDDKQGWYTGNNRAFFSMYKDSGGTLYEEKSQIFNQHKMQQKVIPIGSWDMTASTELAVYHHITDYQKIRDVSVMIKEDNVSGAMWPLINMGNRVADGDCHGGVRINSIVCTLYRFTGGVFDSISFNDPAVNRGWITITYEE